MDLETLDKLLGELPSTSRGLVALRLLARLLPISLLNLDNSDLIRCSTAIEATATFLGGYRQRFLAPSFQLADDPHFGLSSVEPLLHRLNVLVREAEGPVAAATAELVQDGLNSFLLLFGGEVAEAVQEELSRDLEHPPESLAEDLLETASLWPTGLPVDLRRAWTGVEPFLPRLKAPIPPESLSKLSQTKSLALAARAYARACDVGYADRHSESVFLTYVNASLGVISLEALRHRPEMPPPLAELIQANPSDLGQQLGIALDWTRTEALSRSWTSLHRMNSADWRDFEALSLAEPTGAFFLTSLWPEEDRGQPGETAIRRDARALATYMSDQAATAALRILPGRVIQELDLNTIVKRVRRDLYSTTDVNELRRKAADQATDDIVRELKTKAVEEIVPWLGVLLREAVSDLKSERIRLTKAQDQTTSHPRVFIDAVLRPGELWQVVLEDPVNESNDTLQVCTAGDMRGLLGSEVDLSQLKEGWRFELPPLASVEILKASTTTGGRPLGKAVRMEDSALAQRIAELLATAEEVPGNAG